jgi:hypothetical protein
MTKRLSAVALLLLLAAMSASADTRTQIISSPIAKARQQVVRFAVWVQSKISPPWPAPDEKTDPAGRLSPPWPQP